MASTGAGAEQAVGEDVDSWGRGMPWPMGEGMGSQWEPTGQVKLIGHPCFACFNSFWGFFSHGLDNLIWNCI